MAVVKGNPNNSSLFLKSCFGWCHLKQTNFCYGNLYLIEVIMEFKITADCPIKPLSHLKDKIIFSGPKIKVSFVSLLSCLHPGFRLPRVAETEIWQRLQDPSPGPSSDSCDGRRERAESAYGWAHAGDGGLASEHLHAARTKLAGQQHRRHSPQEKEGQNAHENVHTWNKRTSKITPYSLLSCYFAVLSMYPTNHNEM